MAQLINKKTNALKYAPENWGDGNVFKNLSHKQIINETLDLIKENVLNNGITVNFHNQNIHFDCLQEKDFSITWMFDDLKKIGANGAYDSNKEMISLGTHLQKNGPKAYGVLYHEMTHHLQHKLIQYIDHYPKDSLEHDYLSLLKYEIEHSVIKGKSFGIEFEGDVYIDKNALSFLSRDSILIDALYRLQVSERNALAVEQASIEFVLSLIFNINAVK